MLGQGGGGGQLEKPWSTRRNNEIKRKKHREKHVENGKPQKCWHGADKNYGQMCHFQLKNNDIIAFIKEEFEAEVQTMK